MRGSLVAALFGTSVLFGTSALANPIPVSKQIGQWAFRPDITAGSTVTITVTTTPPVTPAPSFSAAPTVTGTPQTDSVLTAADPSVANGTITAREWDRNGTPIAGATGTSYTVTDADFSAAITYKISASGAGGSTTAASAAKTGALFATVLPAEATAAGYTHQVFHDEMLATSSIHTEGASGNGVWSQYYWYGAQNFSSAHNDGQFDPNATPDVNGSKSCGVNTMVSQAYSGDTMHVWANGQLTMQDKLASSGATPSKYISTAQGSNCGKYLGSIMTTSRGFSGSGNGTNQGYEGLYFYTEARIYFSPDAGRWDAFWMETNVNQLSRINEFDIAETQSIEQTHNYTTVHEHSPTNGSVDLNHTPFAITTIPNGGVLAGWHVYGMNWTPTEIDMYLDGVKTASYPTSTYAWIAHMDQPMFLILTEGAGNDNSGTAIGSYPDPTKLPGSMKVDYVRVYQ